MRKMRRMLLPVFLGFFLLQLTELKAQASQEQAFVFTIANDLQINSRQLEFDLLLWDSIPAQPLKFALLQAGITVNPLIKNGGSLTVEILPGTSTLNIYQEPITVKYFDDYNWIFCPPKAPPGCSQGSYISQNPDVRTRYCRIRLTNSVAFTANSHADLAFSFAIPPYKTKLFYYRASDCMNSAAPATPANIYSMASNVSLNAGPTCPFPFLVTGTGSYCETDAGRQVGLNGSETGVVYTLYKGGLAQSPSIPGTGEALSFGLQTVGTYTIIGVNAVCPDGIIMNDSAVIALLPAGTSLVPEFEDISPLCQNSDPPVLPGSSTNFIPGIWNPATINTTIPGEATYTFSPDLECALETSIVVLVNPLPSAAGTISGPTTVNPGVAGIVYSIDSIAEATEYIWQYSGACLNLTANGPAVSMDFDEYSSSGYLSVSGINSCGNGLESILQINVQGGGSSETCYWNGLADHDWDNPANWDPYVPDENSSVYIVSGCPHYPLISAANPCKVIDILGIMSGAELIGQQYLCPAYTSILYNMIDTAFHMVSSPVYKTTFGWVCHDINPIYLYSREYNEPSGDWVNNTMSDTLFAGKGYSMQSTVFQNAPLSFNGQMNIADVSCSLSNSNPSTDLNRVGWNLLGNPFTSAIDWDLFPPGDFDAQVAVWDEQFGGYRYWNHSVGNLQDGIIPPLNGFFVKTTQPGGTTLTIPLSSQVFTNHPFYKESASNALKIRVNANGYADEAFIHFNPNATTGYDSKYDALKLWGNENAPQLYSMIPENNLSINELPMASDIMIDLGFQCGRNGTYVISGSGLESFELPVSVWLEDLKTNDLLNLLTNPEYTFEYQTGDAENRFRLHLSSAYSIPEKLSEGIFVYSNSHTVYVNNSTDIKGEIRIYDLSGRELNRTTMAIQSVTRIPVRYDVGCYLVRISTDQGLFCKKVYVE